jgi:hypothetical protein
MGSPWIKTVLERQLGKLSDAAAAHGKRVGKDRTCNYDRSVTSGYFQQALTLCRTYIITEFHLGLCISLMKQQFSVTRTIRQSEITALLDGWVRNTPSVKMLCPQTSHLPLYFRTNITCLSGGRLRIGQVFSVACNTVYRWLATTYCFISDFLNSVGLYVPGERTVFSLRPSNHDQVTFNYNRTRL